MAELINSRYQGVVITVALTGLPIVITGEVLNGDNAADIVTLKLKDGKCISLANALIAFFY